MQNIPELRPKCAAQTRATALSARFTERQTAPAATPAPVPQVELLGDDFLAVAPDLILTIQSLRGWLSAMVNHTASAGDMPAIDDAIARSGHLLRRAAGEDVRAAVAAYEASLLETPDEDDTFDDDFGRYGRHDD